MVTLASYFYHTGQADEMSRAAQLAAPPVEPRAQTVDSPSHVVMGGDETPRETPRKPYVRPATSVEKQRAAMKEVRRRAKLLGVREKGAGFVRRVNAAWAAANFPQSAV